MLPLLPLLLALTAAGAQPDRQTIVAFGDSITAPRGPLRVYAKILADELHAKLINSGIGGHNTRMARARFERDVLAHQPDIAIILFGANDAVVDVWKVPPATEPRVSLEDYAANLRYFCRELKQRGVRVLLVTPTPFRWTQHLRALYGQPPYDPDDPDGFNVVLVKYAQAVRTIAAEEQVTLIDAWQAFEAHGEQAGQSLDELLLDGMHPNAKGQKILADLLLTELR